jgi:hypothetical protein
LINDEELKRITSEISESISMNYLVDLRKQIKTLKSYLKKKEKLIGVVQYMTPALQDFVNQFTNLEDEAVFQLDIAKWYFANKRYTNGYICLVESIITKLCNVYGLDIKEFSHREKMKKLLSKEEFYSYIPVLRKIQKVYKSCKKIRNNIAHASYNENKTNCKEDIKYVDKYYKKVSKFFRDHEVKNLPQQIVLDEKQQLVIKK